MDSGTGTKTPHILLLEDDRAHQDLILRAFRNDPEPFRVTVAGNILDARQVIGRDPPDLIIADWILPDGKGLDILPRRDGRVTIPLVIMTRFGDEHLAVKIMKSGAIDYVVKSATLFRDLPHIARRALHDWENILERKRAEEVVQESQKRLADIIGFLPDAVLAIDNDGRVIAWNDAIERMTGVVAKDMIGKGDHEYSIPFYGERRPILIDLVLMEDGEVEKKYDDIQRDGRKITSEMFIPTLYGGKGAYLWGTASPLLDSAGNHVGAIEVIRDITERRQAEESMREQKAILETLLNAPSDTIALLDRQGTIIDINEAGARRLGSTVKHLTGRCVYDILPPDVARTRKEYIDLVFTTGEPVLFDDARSGAYFHNEIFPVFNPARTVVDHIAIFTRDITDQKKSEQALQKSEDRFRHVSGLTSDFAYSCTRSPEGGFLIDWITGAFRRITGYSEEEILVMGCWRGIVVEEDLPVFDGKIAGLLPGISSRCELRIMSKDGAIKWLMCFAECISDPADTASYRLYGGCQDITDQREKDQALRESERKYRFLIDNVRDIVWQTTPDLTFTYLSRVAETLTGYSPGDLIGTSLLDLLTESSARVVRERLRERMEEYSHGSRDLATVFEIEITQKIGGTRWLEVGADAVFGPGGSLEGFQGISRDITERKRTETALIESEVRFRDLFSNMGAGVAIYEVVDNGEDFIIKDINSAVEKIEKVKKEDVAGRSILEVFPGVKDFGLFAVLQRVARTGIAESHPVSIYRDNRISGWRENYVYKLPSGEIVAIYEDVTEKKQAEEKLRESEERYRALLFGAGIGVGYWSTDGTLLLINEISLRRLNGTERDFIGKSMQELFGDNADVYLDRIRKAAVSPDPMEYEDYVSLPVGKGWYLSVYTRISRPDGSVMGIQVLSMDITGRKQAEEKLRNSEKKYHRLYDSMRDAFASVDMGGRITLFNEPFQKMVGYEKEEIDNLTYNDLTPDKWHTIEADIIKNQVLTRGYSEIYEKEYRRKDGTVIPVELRTFLIKDDTGNPQSMSAIVRDITERKRAEEALRDSEEKYRNLAENVHDGVYIYDGSAHFMFVNHRAADITGFSEEELLSMNILDIVHPDDHTYIRDIIAKRFGGSPAPDTYELHIVRKDGIMRVLEISVSRITYRGQFATLGAARDITDRKKAEEKLRESEERYRALLFGAGIGVGYWSTDGTLLLLNEISLKRLKGTEKDFIGKSMQELFGEEADMYLDRIRKAAVSPDPMEYEDYISLPVGKGWYLSVYTRISRPDGSVMGIQVLSMDITERKQAEDFRKAYEARLDSAMEIGSLAWWEMDLPDGAVRFDDRKAAMLGYPPEKFRHYTDFTSLLHPDDYEPAMKAMRDHLEGRESRYHSDYRIRSNAGTFRWFRDVGGVTKRHADGSPATITGIVIDISASKEAEEALRSTEIRFRALIQNSSDIIRILNREGRIVYESDSAERILGYPPGHLIGSNPMDYIHPDDLELVKNDFRDVLDRTNPGTPTEFRIRKADGEYLWVDAIATNLLEVPGVNGIVVTTRPIQQRKEAEQALKKNQARLATAMDIAGLVNWEFDVASGMFTFDDRFYALYRTSAVREGGNLMSAETYMQEFVYPDDRPAVLASIQNILATTDPDYAGQIEHRITPRDGSVRTIIARFAPVMGPDGKVIRTYGANQDITDLKLMEAEIRSLNTTLEQRVRDRTEALAKTNEALEAEIAQRLAAEKKLQASFDEKVTLLKEVHHRVKNNLQIIASLLNLQSRYIKDESSLAVIRESQNRIKAMALVHEKLYRAEDLSHISLSDYIRFLGTGLFQFYDARSRGIQFILDIHEVNVDIDAAIPLGLIMNELISNSLKYAFPQGRKGEISISVKKEGHTLTVVYRDTGIGIPAEMDWRNTPSLGLRLVNTLVDQLNGTVELDRSAGTEFTMVLHEKEQKGEE